MKNKTFQKNNSDVIGLEIERQGGWGGGGEGRAKFQSLWDDEERSQIKSYFEIHFYFDSVKNYDNNSSVDMYIIGNHRSRKRTRCSAPAYKRG